MAGPATSWWKRWKVGPCPQPAVRALASPPCWTGVACCPTGSCAQPGDGRSNGGSVHDADRRGRTGPYDPDLQPGAQQRRQAGRPRATASDSATCFQPDGTGGWTWTTPSAPPPSRSSSASTTRRAPALTPCGAAPQKGLVWYAVGCGPTRTWRRRTPGRCGWQKGIPQLGRAAPRVHQSGSTTTCWPTLPDGGCTRPGPVPTNRLADHHPELQPVHVALRTPAHCVTNSSSSLRTQRRR